MIRRRTNGVGGGAAPRAVKVGIAAVVALLVGGAVLTNAAASSGNPVKSHPAPRLFDAAQVAPLAKDLAAMKPRADAAFATWSAAHPGRDDAAFTTFALAQLPPPPGPATQKTELAELHQLAASRTPAGLAAAAWLEVYGKADVWKLYASDAAELAPATVKAADKQALKQTSTLDKSLASTAEARFHRASPGQVDPSLRQGLSRRIRPSYPSKHAVYVYSQLAVVTALDPGRAAEFQAMADQVAYSRLYTAGHYRSDLLVGAFLGDLIGDYEVRGLQRR